MQGNIPILKRKWFTVLVTNSDYWDNNGQRPHAGSYVTKLIFEKLFEQLNGKSRTVSMVDWFFQVMKLVGARMNGLSI